MGEELFQALFRTAPDAMIVVDRDGRIVLTNPQADRLFGYPGDSLRGRPIEDLLPASVRAIHVAHRTSYMAHPRVRPMGAGYELTGVRADGTPFPVEIGLSPVSGDGSLFAASIRDISETQRARQALARSHYDASLADISRRILGAANHEEAMAEVPAIIASTLSVPVVAVLLPDPYGKSFRVAAAHGAHGPWRDALADAAWLRDVLPLLRFSADEQAIVRVRIPIPLPDPDGGLRDADALLAPLPDRQAPTGYVVVMVPRHGPVDRDRQHYIGSVANMLAAAIQRGRSEEQLAHAQRLDALGQLTGGIAHDFNNLLTVISGNLQLLETELPDDTAVRESTASASRAVERGSALTRKLLAFSRRQRLNPRRVRSELLLADLHDLLGRTLGERIRVVAECPDGLPPVFADPGELEAALVNLALNARDAMPCGGRLAISVRLHAQAEDENDFPAGTYVMFSVVDDGEGMHPDVLAKALEPFFTTKVPGKGSGLGLSMVYGFVKQSRGRLNIESHPGEGTRVEIYLPVAEVSDAVSEPATEPLGGHETVLVVEDEAEVRRIAVAFLRTLGYRVFEAGSASAAQQAFARHPDIDAVFTDVVLGDGDSGFDLAERLRIAKPSLKVLMASGYEYVPPGVDPHRRDRHALLRKPYRREQLAAALRGVLDADD